jgi:hypothetical protein
MALSEAAELSLLNRLRLAVVILLMGIGIRPPGLDPRYHGALTGHICPFGFQRLQGRPGPSPTVREALLGSGRVFESSGQDAAHLVGLEQEAIVTGR